MYLNLAEKAGLCIVIAVVLFVPVIICVVRRRRRLARNILEQDCYYLYEPFVYSIVGIIGIFMSFAGIAAMIFMTDTDLISASIFLCMAFFCEFASCFLLTYEIRCDAYSLTECRSPLPPKRIMLYEVTNVRYVENRNGPLAGGQMHLYLYRGEKKALDVGQDMIGFGRLLEQLASERKLERAIQKENGLEISEIKEDFSIAETMANRVRAAFCLLLFGGMFAAILWNWEEMISDGVWDTVFLLVGFFVFTVIYLKSFLCKMLRKVTVSYRTIVIRNALGKTVSYSMGEITQALERKHDIEIYADKKMILRVEKDARNYALLAERLLKEGLFVPYSEGVGRQAPEKTAADDDQVVDGTEFSDL